MKRASEGVRAISVRLRTGELRDLERLEADLSHAPRSRVIAAALASFAKLPAARRVRELLAVIE